MKIYSWNMLFRNRELDRAFSFISEADFDVFCLQEVPEPFLARLKTLPCHIAYRSDVERLFPGKSDQNYVVILSKHNITNQGEIPFPDYWHLLPLRSRLFVRLMRPFGFSRIRNRGGLFADLDIDNRSVRVFNLHLILAHPAWRLHEFELAMAEREPSGATVVCGDFNIIQSPHISILNWILGGKIGDAFFPGRERIRINKHFAEHELVNALEGTITHPFSRSQLDHILFSPTFTIEKVDVIADRMGSDHNPIRAQVT